MPLHGKEKFLAARHSCLCGFVVLNRGCAAKNARPPRLFLRLINSCTTNSFTRDTIAKFPRNEIAGALSLQRNKRARRFHERELAAGCKDILPARVAHEGRHAFLHQDALKLLDALRGWRAVWQISWIPGD